MGLSSKITSDKCESANFLTCADSESSRLKPPIAFTTVAT